MHLISPGSFLWPSFQLRSPPCPHLPPHAGYCTQPVFSITAIPPACAGISPALRLPNPAPPSSEHTLSRHAHSLSCFQDVLCIMYYVCGRPTGAFLVLPMPSTINHTNPGDRPSVGPQFTWTLPSPP
ncbi:hypothetical protein C8R44DRAFT_783424 [Mycena epipterygia]|nr:hypothetical protein C8R44DRAFT_783424 [Mycena epipterygia]